MTLTRLYAHLLRLYPHPFYSRFGDEMLGVFEEAWQARRPGKLGTASFVLREFSGLFAGIVRERWLASRQDGRPLLFRWRLMLPLLILVSGIAACLISLDYWGFVVRPVSIFGRVAAVDSVALVRFDDNMQPIPIPLNELPHRVLEEFPPSQIVPQLHDTQAGLIPAKHLDSTLVDQLTAALASYGVDFGDPRAQLPREPILNPDGCNGCFRVGLQLRDDGVLLQTWPEIDGTGAFTGATTVSQLTANDWSYYSHLLPAAYIVEGRAADGTPLIFVGAASSATGGGDRYRYDEWLFDAAGDGLVLRDSMNYRFDVAGLEGFYAPVITAALFVPLLLLWLALMLVAAIVSTVRRRFTGWRVAGRT